MKKPSKKVLKQVQQLVEAGSWVAGIRIYWKATGVSLKEAHDTVYAMYLETLKPKSRGASNG